MSTGFLSRWSRLKRQGGAAPAAVAAAPPPAPLPSIDALNFDADFTGFLRQEVEEAVRRVALKKLFHSGPFNAMDGLDTYIDDYSIPDPIDDECISGLIQARGLLFDELPAADGDGAGPAAKIAALPAAETPDAIAADAAAAGSHGATHVAT